MNNKMPDKPKTQKAQIDMLWDACFNHIPSKLKWMNLKINMVLTFGAFALALLGIVIALVR